MKKCKIFYDGVNIEKYIDEVDGVTTNTSFIAEANITKFLQIKFVDNFNSGA